MTSEQEQEATGSIRVFYDESIAGRHVEADGGGWVEEARAGYRATFEGTLTGRRMVQGDPPWRWMELGDLTDAPADFEESYVWIEDSYVYFDEDQV